MLLHVILGLTLSARARDRLQTPQNGSNPARLPVGLGGQAGVWDVGPTWRGGETGPPPVEGTRKMGPQKETRIDRGGARWKKIELYSKPGSKCVWWLRPENGRQNPGRKERRKGRGLLQQGSVPRSLILPSQVFGDPVFEDAHGRRRRFCRPQNIIGAWQAGIKLKKEIDPSAKKKREHKWHALKSAKKTGLERDIWLPISVCFHPGGQKNLSIFPWVPSSQHLEVYNHPSHGKKKFFPFFAPQPGIEPETPVLGTLLPWRYISVYRSIERVSMAQQKGVFFKKCWRGRASLGIVNFPCSKIFLPPLIAALGIFF